MDADHEEGNVREDVRVWVQHMSVGGVLVLHDVGAWPGPTKVAGELRKRFEVAEIVGNCMAFVIRR